MLTDERTVDVDRTMNAGDQGTRTPVVLVDQIVKTFGEGRDHVVALNGVDLSVPRGQFVVLVGPSGCGKTTLLRILGGLESADSGSARIERGAAPIATATVFQGDSLMPWMTLGDNVAYPLRLRGVGRKEARARAMTALSRTGIEEKFFEFRPYEVSGGMRQRGAIARALIAEPSVLLMDEPFSALDELNRVRLQNELLQIWAEYSVTVVFITHSVDEAITLGDRVITMGARPGRFISDRQIPFDRPREALEVRTRPGYSQLVHEIWKEIGDEVERLESDA